MIELLTFYTNKERTYIFPLKKTDDYVYQCFLYFTSSDTMMITKVNLRKQALKKEEPSYRYKQEMISEIWRL